MTGSALGLFLCRGCRLHFMLRPACLLRAVQLLLPRTLLTPGFSRRGLPLCCGPAARRSSAYRDGTYTRWIITARRQVPGSCRSRLSVVVTTHHRASITRDRAGREIATDGPGGWRLQADPVVGLDHHDILGPRRGEITEVAAEPQVPVIERVARPAVAPDREH